MDYKFELHLQVKPEVEKTLNKICDNFKAISALLEDNKNLLTEVLKCSFELVDASLDSSEVITGDTDSEAA